jgi:hypothetical protein
MKHKKMKGVLGVVLALVLIASMMAFALPTSAAAYEPIVPMANMWVDFQPTPLLPGGWFNDPSIGGVGPIADDIAGNIYAGVVKNTTDPVAQVSTVTLSGSPRAGDVVSVDIDGNTITYTALTTDIGGTDAISLANIAIGLRDAINADATVSAIVTATAANAVVTVTADTAGLAGAFVLDNCTVTQTTASTLATADAQTVAPVAAVAQVDTVTPTAADNTNYVLRITFGGNDYDFVYTSSAAPATAAEITDAFVSLINTHPTVSAWVTAANNADTIQITADTAGLAGAFTTTDQGTGTLTVVNTTAAADPVPEEDTVTLSGSPRLNDVVTVTVDGNPVAYTVIEADIGASDAASRTNIAVKIAAAINGDATVGALVTASAAGDVITLVEDNADGSGFTMSSAVTNITDSTIAVACATATAAADATVGGFYLYKSLPSSPAGRTWSASTAPLAYSIAATGAANVGVAPIVDMVCSEVSEDIIYVTDGYYILKSVDGGMNFMRVAENSWETMILGVCGPAVDKAQFDAAFGPPVTCLDVAYDANGNSLIFAGVMYTFVGGIPDANYPSVLYINEGGFPSQWTDLQLHCFHASGATPGGYWPLSIGCAPDFETTKKVYVTVTNDDDVTVGGVDPHTHVVASVGITCDWTSLSELFWDCDNVTPNNFQIRHASRFAFPSDFATTKTMFVGVAGLTGGGLGGDVYNVVDSLVPTLALDLNVNPGIGGCTGMHANICSLDMVGDTANGSLIAGALDDFQLQAPVEVYYSNDGGWTWAKSLKDPTGAGWTYVIFYEDATIAFAGTKGCDCGFSMSCGATVGQFWNQISLISMEIDEVLDLSFGPTYVTGTPIMFALTEDNQANTPPCTTAATLNSLLRYDDATGYWERVHSSRWYYVTTVVTLLEGPLYEWVEQSPDFDDTMCVYLANTASRFLRSLDAGCSWIPLSYPCDEVPISAWIVVDESTVLTAGCGTRAAAAGTGNGFIYRTTTAGSRPWDVFTVLNCVGTPSACGVDFDLSPNVVVDENVLLGDSDGQVFLSTDLGATWMEIKDAVTMAKFGADDANTYVVFDPGYATAGDPGENTVYAAAGTAIGRVVVDPTAASQCASDWLYLSNGPQAECDTFNLCLATGIDIDGDPALYVSDAGTGAPTDVSCVSGTLSVDYYDATPTLVRCDLTLVCAEAPLTLLSGTIETGEQLTVIDWNLYCDTVSSIKGEVIVMGLVNGGIGEVAIEQALAANCVDCDHVNSAYAVVSSNLKATITTGIGACASGVWRTVNPLDLIVEAAGLNYVEFEFLWAAGTTFIHPEADNFAPVEIYPDDLWLTHASNVLWTLDAADVNAIWAFEDPLATPVVQLSPADGALLTSATYATLEWEALDGAFLYELKVYEECPECIDPTEMKLFATYETDDTCYKVTGLTAGTKYFWKVRVACDSPLVSKWSDIRSFNTALSAIAELCSPICGASDIIPTTNYSWSEVLGATAYEVQIVEASADGTADFTGATTYTSDVNALASIPGLQYSTVYFWRVRAIKDGVAGAWSVCLFTVMDEPEECPEPITPVTITTEEVTPVWIWVIIGIGGALTIVVIILIVTTRRAS